jgi:hypothetical protein
MKKLIKFSFVIVFLVILSSCTKLAPKRSEAEQHQVKERVIKLLEQEYKQPFEIESFKYEYKTNYEYSFFYVKGDTYGTFKFKIKAVDNPIIEMDFEIIDNNELFSKYEQNEPVKGLVGWFKKNQLSQLYCTSLRMYYKNLTDSNQKVKQPNTEIAENFCKSINQSVENSMYKKTYNNLHSIK